MLSFHILESIRCQIFGMDIPSMLRSSTAEVRREKKSRASEPGTKPDDDEKYQYQKALLIFRDRDAGGVRDEHHAEAFGTFHGWQRCSS